MKNTHLLIVVSIIAFITGGILIGKQSLNSVLPLFLTVLCPLSMLFMMGGHNHNKNNEKGGAFMEEGKTVYTCPMHSEVIKEKPGSCPKCGMILVKKEGKNE
jgi:hypothetical protein